MSVQTPNGVSGRGVRTPSRGVRTPIGSPVFQRRNPNSQHTDGSTHVVPGGKLTVSQIQSRFHKFIDQYPEYETLIENHLDEDDDSFPFSLHQLKEFDEELYTQTLNNPEGMIPVYDTVVLETARKLLVTQFIEDFNMQPGNEDQEDLTFDTLPVPLQEQLAKELLTNLPYMTSRPFDVPPGDTPTLRQLGPVNVDKLVSIRGMVTKVSSITPDLTKAHFRCQTCSKEELVSVTLGRVAHPGRCSHCGQQNTMDLIHNRCMFIDKRTVRIQEAPDDMASGDTPLAISLSVYDTIIDVCRPGDRVQVTGIYRAVPVRMNRTQRTVKRVFRTFVDVVHIKRIRSGSLFSATQQAASEVVAELQAEEQGLPVQNSQLEEIMAMAQQPGIYETLSRSVAPSLFGLEDVKKGLLLQAFSGVGKAAGGVTYRGEINILLVGDPGTAKSQLLQYVRKIIPRGIYTSGRGSSAVGLTAYVNKDPETGEMVLESGALVLSDQGICAIDEFDKLTESTRTVLHEVMEQQTISIAKAGIVCTLNARTAVLAAANPIDSKYNSRKSVIANIDLAPTLLSRFDLIYIMLDTPEETADRRLAEHLVSMYLQEAQTLHADIVHPAKLARYIAVARKLRPRLSDEAVEMLEENYLELRALGMAHNTVSAMPRQLESLVRLSEARARVRLGDTVTKDDVHEAYRLFKVALQQSATDPETGLIDMGMVATGRSNAGWSRLSRISSEVMALLESRQAGTGNAASMRVTDLLSEINRSDDGSASRCSLEELNDILQALDSDGKISKVRDLVVLL
eukprot:gnl/Dysnectes_brevis/3512_a4458_519.p1 GENE.gnl/Dysnectes_brevis/3512_a4458_519~~gnl/Dysnectes_brevis/3512_a4458_519.p1  ORF type:complete len:794 (+),score=293.77 gnl/Dysnectes_brevis/3512_a4458_519:88-2469(+)